MSVSESQVRKLFFVIQNSYDYFDDNDDKVLLWMDYLSETSFETAQNNLREHIMNPDNKKPPHPGALAQTALQKADGPYIPNAAETRRMIEQRDALKELAVPAPIHVREAVKLLAGSRHSTSDT